MSIKRLFAFFVFTALSLLLFYNYYSYTNTKKYILQKQELESKANVFMAKNFFLESADRQMYKFSQIQKEYFNSMKTADEYFEKKGGKADLSEVQSLLNQKESTAFYDILLIDNNYVIKSGTYKPDLGIDFKLMPYAHSVLKKTYENPSYIDVSPVIYDQVRNHFIQYIVKRSTKGDFLIQLGAYPKNRHEEIQNIQAIFPSILSGVIYTMGAENSDMSAVEYKYSAFYKHKNKRDINKFKADNERNLDIADFESLLKKVSDKPVPKDKAGLNNFLNELFLGKDYLEFHERDGGKYIYTVIAKFSSYQELQEKSGGFLVMSFDESDAVRELDALLIKTILFFTTTLTLLVLIFFIAFVRIIKPLAALRQKMGESEYFDEELLTVKQDEIGSMIRIYNKMLNSLKVAIQENKDLLESFKIFASNSIHQIRTPISVLKISQEMLSPDEADAKEQIKSSIVTMEHIYDNLAYKVQRDFVDFVAERICISDILRDRIRLFNVVAHANDKPIVTAIKNGLFIHINKTELEYLIDNNISNAIKYGEAQRTIFIELYQNERGIVLVFSNDGKQIKNKEAIFDRYTRETVEKQGHGIGLHIVKEIANRYNIKILVEYQNGMNIFEYTFAPDCLA